MGSVQCNTLFPFFSVICYICVNHFLHTIFHTAQFSSAAFYPHSWKKRMKNMKEMAGVNQLVVYDLRELPMFHFMWQETNCLFPGGEGQEHGPVFLMEPPARLVFSNSTGARVSCAAHGYPPPHLTWLQPDHTALPSRALLRLGYTITDRSNPNLTQITDYSI